MSYDTFAASAFVGNYRHYRALWHKEWTLRIHRALRRIDGRPHVNLKLPTPRPYKSWHQSLAHLAMSLPIPDVDLEQGQESEPRSDAGISSMSTTS